MPRAMPRRCGIIAWCAVVIIAKLVRGCVVTVTVGTSAPAPAAVRLPCRPARFAPERFESAPRRLVAPAGRASYMCSSGNDGAPGPGHEHVLLVRRGRCAFSDKVRHAHALGASALLVYDSAETSSTGNANKASRAPLMDMKGRIAPPLPDHWPVFAISADSAAVLRGLFPGAARAAGDAAATLAPPPVLLVSIACNASWWAFLKSSCVA